MTDEEDMVAWDNHPFAGWPPEQVRPESVQDEPDVVGKIPQFFLDGKLGDMPGTQTASKPAIADVGDPLYHLHITQGPAAGFDPTEYASYDLEIHYSTPQQFKNILSHLRGMVDYHIGADR